MLFIFFCFVRKIIRSPATTIDWCDTASSHTASGFRKNVVTHPIVAYEFRFVYSILSFWNTMSLSRVDTSHTMSDLQTIWSEPLHVQS